MAEESCLDELKLPNFYVSIFLEALASFLLVFVGGSEYVKYERPFAKEDILQIAFVFGGIHIVLSQCLKDVSKAHINPAITLASTLTKRVSLLRGFCYILFQFGGGTIYIYSFI